MNKKIHLINKIPDKTNKIPNNHRDFLHIILLYIKK